MLNVLFLYVFGVQRGFFGLFACTGFALPQKGLTANSVLLSTGS